MSNHLPECGYGIEMSFDGVVQPAEPCCCDRLRACEQRVEELAKAKIEAVAMSYHQSGYAAGLQAARDAVAALNCPTTFASPLMFDLAKAVALAAIDALKEKP